MEDASIPGAQLSRIIVWGAIWGAFYYALSPIVSGLFFPGIYCALLKGGDRTNGEAGRARKDIVDWDAKWPTLLHAIIASALSFYCCFLDEAMQMDPKNGTSESWEMLTAVTCGYFSWDFYIHIRHIDVFGMPMLLHAAISLATYLLCAFTQPRMGWYVCSLTLFEISTPFLIFRWICIKTKSSKDTVQFSTVVFGLVFFAVRIIWGMFFAYPPIMQIVLDTQTALPVWKRMGFGFMTVFFACLNLYWMYRLVRRIAHGCKRKGN